MEARPRKIETYFRKEGNCPFDEWFACLRDPIGKALVDKRLARVRLGLLGDWNDVGEGVIELIFRNTGPGYRVYIGQDGQTLVILLGGGIKRTQQSDIERAKEYWRDYKE